MSENAPRTNLPELSVGELSQRLKRSIEDQFSHVRVRGEISGFKRHSSGHLYFALKDADAVLDAVCWRGQAARLGIRPEDGMEVVATGRLTTYPGRSKYQIVVEQMELAGEGALLKLLEDRRRNLLAEGLFEPERKQRLPYLPRVIGVVTSPTGAVIRDILHRLADRFPRHVLVWPVAVQGEGAAAQVAAAIRGFDALPADGPVPRPDLLIVARGGGSLEDLWAFNEEVVVRAVADCTIPVVSAVGHETDTTLIDFAADVRAPTPTAAAELAVPVRADLIQRTAEAGARAWAALAARLRHARAEIDGLARGLPDPVSLLGTKAQFLDDRTERLANAAAKLVPDRAARLDGAAGRLRHPREVVREAATRTGHLAERLERAAAEAMAREARALDRAAARLDDRALRLAIQRGARDAAGEGGRLVAAARTRLARAGEILALRGQMLDGLSYERVLERGFVLVRDQGGHPVTRRADARAGQRLSLRFADGELGVQADRDGAPRPPAPVQGTLL
ncbi:exodeoxyribonuclease VII large subunit [Stella sp.]|uniref:exodeoxyribonuclease VII large subunit n=1 Tax=Stella sp. TaxID=2912054 RepID=UPI0035B0B029